MRFNKLDVGIDLSKEKGLKPINISRLGEVVALIGKNGSGKTRILDLLEHIILPKIAPHDITSRDINIEDDKLRREIFENEKIHNWTKLNYLTSILGRQKGDNDPTVKKMRADLKLAQSKFREGEFPLLKDNFNNLSLRLHEFIDTRVRRINTVNLLNLKEKIEDASKSEFELFERLVNIAPIIDSNYNEISSIESSAIDYFDKLGNDLVDDLLTSLGDKEILKTKESHVRFEILRDTFNSFFGKELNWKVKKISSEKDAKGIRSHTMGIWTIDNREFKYNEFSDGEKTLLAYVFLFYLYKINPKINITESIIIIDEPELHLHPELEIRVVEGIRNIIKERGQLWIATHSINILASLKYGEIFMVKNGTIYHPTSLTPGKTLNELLPLNDRLNQLSRMIHSIADWAFLNFMTECFDDPNVVESSNSDDPQLTQFKESLKKGEKENRLLLDFGAGEGRFFSSLPKNFFSAQNIEYFALEINADSHDSLVELGVNQDNIFDNYNSLPREKFSHILICNVLHEISPTLWKDTLNNLLASLDSDGYLIIMEDKLLPVGEKIGEIGFLLLDKEQLQLLFRVEEDILEIYHQDERYKDRLLCAIIAKRKSKGVNSSSVVKALDSLQRKMMLNIRELRSADIEEHQKLEYGRLSALYSQQYVNAIIALNVVERPLIY